MVMALVQTLDRNINQIQQNIRTLLDPLAALVQAAGQYGGVTTAELAAEGNIGQMVPTSAPQPLLGATTVSAGVFADDQAALTLPAGDFEVICVPVVRSTYVAAAGNFQLALRSGNVTYKALSFSLPVTAAVPTAWMPISLSVPLLLASPTTFKLSLLCDQAAAAAYGDLMADGSTPGGGLKTSSYWYAKRRR